MWNQFLCQSAFSTGFIKASLLGEYHRKLTVSPGVRWTDQEELSNRPVLLFKCCFIQPFSEEFIDALMVRESPGKLA